MTPFATRVRDVINRYGMLAPANRILVGVSGGADSVSLLLVLLELGYFVGTAHVNHGLRGAESDADEEFVADLARRLGVPFFSRQLPKYPVAGNPEAYGRAARKEFFARISNVEGFAKIALAHNRQDRVETFLLNLMRGSGMEGMVSMAPITGNTIRPLIECGRDEIEAYLGESGQSWRTDHTNSDMSLARNRIRHEVIPRLTSLFNNRLVEALSRTITVLQDEDAYLREVARNWIEEYGAPEKEGEEGIVLEVAPLQTVPPALARRIIRRALLHARPGLTDVRFDHIESVRALLEDGKSGKRVVLPGGVGAAREFNRLVVGAAKENPVEFNYDLPIPGIVHIPEVGRTFRAEVLGSFENHPGKELEDDNRVLVDGRKLGDHVRIRNWKPGDYYRPGGWPAGKVKKLFQRARIPRSQRSSWPVFEADSTIVWVASFPVSREFASCGQTEKIVAFEALQG